MIPDQCRNCEVYGFCTTTEPECVAYHEGFAWGEPPILTNHCSTCQSNSYCTSRPELCDGEPPVFSADADPFFSVGMKGFHGNKGLINWVTGPIVKIEKGDYMALVTIQVGGHCMTAMLPLQKFEELGHSLGDTITFAIKALNIKILR